MRTKFKVLIINLISALILFCSFLQLYGEWETEPVTSKYYKDEFEKPYYHLGVGYGMGASYYFNYNENNSFIPYVSSIKLVKDINVNEIGILFKIDAIVENKEYTDEVRYYGASFRTFFLLYLGINKKYKSFIPFFDWLLPYVSIGIGKVDVSFEQKFADPAGDLYFVKIRGDGWAVGTDMGIEIFLIENLLSFSMGFKYNYNFIDDVELYNYYNRKLEKKQESYILFYTGFHYFLF